MHPSYRILADSALRLWGLTNAERLERQLARLDVHERVEDFDGLSDRGSVILLDGGHLFDPRLLKALVEAEGVLVFGSEGSADKIVAAHVPTALASTALGVMREEADATSVPELRLVGPEALADAFDERLRRFGQPKIEPVTVENRRVLEDRLFGASYKGVTDFVTKFWWPRPARAVTRVCVRLGLSPNQVTSFGLLLVVLATFLFARGAFGWGLVAAWLMTFLDTVDGKLARVTVTSSRIGHVLDHGTDLVHPPFWYLAWGLGLATFEPLAPWVSLTGTSTGVSLTATIWVIFVGYIVGRLAEGSFQVWVARSGLFLWRRFDSLLRLVTARRNPNIVLLTLSLAFARPDLGLAAVAFWTAATSLLLVVRLVMALRAKESGTLRASWLDATPEQDGSLAVRWFGPPPDLSPGSSPDSTAGPDVVLHPVPPPGARADRRARRVGVISNPRSRRNRLAGLDGLQAELAAHPTALHRVAGSPDEIEAALREFARNDVDVVAINGGDGTVHACLDVLLGKQPFAELPPLAVLPGGRTNMTAADVGVRGGSPLRALQRLVTWADSGAEPGEVATRNVIRVDGAREGGPRFGFFLSTAGIYQATVKCWDFRRESRVPGMKTGLGTAVSVGTQVVGHCLGLDRLDPAPVRVRLDDEDQGERKYLALFVTTLERMALGMRPFWGETPAPLRFTAVDYEHRHLLRAMPGLLRGKPNGYLRPEHGYASRNVDRIALELTGGCTFDGELVYPAPSAPLLLSAERSVSFVRP